MGTNVTIRKRVKKGDKSSLYLDFYPAVILPGTKQATRRKGLGLFLYNKPKSTEEKEHNKRVQNIADQWRAKYLNIVEEKVFFSEIERELYERKETEKQSFKKFYLELLEQRIGKTREQWVTTWRYINLFYPIDFSFADITVKFVEDFKLFLLNYKKDSSTGSQQLHQNTAQTYFKPFRAALNAAYKYEYLSKDICNKVADIPVLETKREFLTIEEITKLKSTPCADDELRRAAFISIYTGLRYSDVNKLLWGEVVESADGVYFDFRQKKTKSLERIPLAENAKEYLGTRMLDNFLVFPNLAKNKNYNKVLGDWIQKAGIKKKITFHCLRHTHATLLLYLGADLYTVSKMLGHTTVQITQVYAKVLDESKRKAANLIQI